VRRLLQPPPSGPSAGELIDTAELARRMERRELNLRKEVDALEAEALRLALLRSGGSPARAARLLGEVGRGQSKDPAGTVRAMMRRLGVY
jgi:transcriptional regulator with GAF, ATPase, and Fis domain